MKDLKEFCYKYEAQVSPSSRPWRRPKRVPLDVWASDPNVFKDIHHNYEDVPTVTITMPEDRFHALLEHDDWVSKAGLQGNNFFNNNVSRVSNMLMDHERECRLRYQHPGVQKAWEQYQIMLRMVDDGK